MSDSSPAAITLTFLPSGRTARVAAGTSLLDAALDLDLQIETLCGGAGLCGRCRIRLMAGALPVTPADQENLTAVELAQGFRLACAAQPDADCTVEIAVAPGAEGTILASGSGRSVELDPAVRRLSVRLDPPTLEQGPSDLEVLLAALPPETQPPPLALLRRLPGLLREGGWRGDAILLNGRLCDFQVTPQPLCGLAIDLGTTTVVARLIDLESGRVLATAAELNRQRRYGEDVIARVGHANAHGPAELQGLIVSQLNEMIAELVATADRGPGAPRSAGLAKEVSGDLPAETGAAGVTGQAAGEPAAEKGTASLPVRIHAEDIYQAVVAGNTVMEHLLLGLPPRHLAEMPYVPAARHWAPVSASEIGLNLHPAAQLHLLPALGKFVGGDTAAVLLTLADRLDRTWLAVDIGTNGEILLCHRGRVWTTSAAAGPAFEGAHIGAGMRAAAGAIERVWWRGEPVHAAAIGRPSAAAAGPFAGHLEVRVIGGGEAQGICGSGLIDAVAALLDADALDASGRLLAGHPLVGKQPAAGSLPDQLAVRLAGQVHLTQRDIRELQLAKAAIATSIELLLQAAGLAPADLEQIYLAGAFGQYLSPQAALRIGLLPQVGVEKIKFIGNAACKGAEMVVVSRKESRRLLELQAKTGYFEAAADPGFQNLFAEHLLFGSL